MKIHHSKIYGYQSLMEHCLSRFSLSSCGRYRRKTSLVPTSSPWFPLSPDRQAFACSLRLIACMSFRCSELKTWRVPSWSGPMQSATPCLHLMTAQGFFFCFPSLIFLLQDFASCLSSQTWTNSSLDTQSLTQGFTQGKCFIYPHWVKDISQ